MAHADVVERAAQQGRVDHLAKMRSESMQSGGVSDWKESYEPSRLVQTLGKDVGRKKKAVPQEPHKAATKPMGNAREKGAQCVSISGMCVGSTKKGGRVITLEGVPSVQHVWAAERKRLTEEIDTLRRDKDRLEKQLQVQTQVNVELKKLLVASVGEDMQTKVEFLTQDKNKLAHDIIHYSQKMVEDTEHLERLSIQCDVWRSKFLASSVMVDELASWKAILSYQLDEAVRVIEILLDEIMEVHIHTRNTQKCLSSVIENGQIPDLLNASSLATRYGTVIEDAAVCEKLGEVIHHKLVHSEPHFSMSSLSTVNKKCTYGESLARQVQSNTPSFDVLPSARGCCSSVGSCAASHYCRVKPRFHPTTRYEHLTFNCCCHCKGDMKLM